MVDTIIESLVDNLNPQQRQAVTINHPGPVLVLAGAGCGKTLVLTRRIAYCAHTTCSQDHILALTFTRKAALEMAGRVKGIVGISADKPMPAITTFHGFGLRVLMDRVMGKRNFDRLGYSGDLRLISEKERLKMLAEHSTRRERQALSVDLLKLDDLLARKAVDPQKLSGLSSDRIRLITEIERRMQEGKRGQGFWDFSDIISSTLRLFETCQDVEEHYAARYQVILVDEFQDTNPLQIALLRRLYARTDRLFAVGDDDQAIYGFRGADIGPIVNFSRHFPGASILKLETNYRSTPAVLNAANRIFRDKPQAYRKVLRSGKYPKGRIAQGPRPRKLHRDSQEKMAYWIHQKACEISRLEKIPVSDMALLFRVNQTLDHTQSLFSQFDGEHPRFLTIHGSKGLEFQVVFLCDLEEEVFPSYRRKRSGRIVSLRDLLRGVFSSAGRIPADCDLAEEKRLFYVGVTRAQKYLFLISAGKKDYYGKIRRFERSRFLKLI